MSANGTPSNPKKSEAHAQKPQLADGTNEPRNQATNERKTRARIATYRRRHRRK